MRWLEQRRHGWPEPPTRSRRTVFREPRPRNRARLVRLIVGMLLALLGSPLGGWRIADERPPSGDVRIVPAGWEVGDCPAAYGADAVLCAGTDTGPFKVDRHIPTLSIRAPAGSCAEAEKYVVSRLSKFGMTVSRKSTGRCGPEAAPCTELRLKDPRPTDPVAPLFYVICPAARPVEVVEYAVSARVIDTFEPLARSQARCDTSSHESAEPEPGQQLRQGAP